MKGDKKNELEDSFAKVWMIPKDQLPLSPEHPRTQDPSGAITGMNKRTDKDERGSRKEAHESQGESRGVLRSSTTSFPILYW